MQLHAVQKAAHAASSGRHGFAYFMEQGLGKTATVLVEFLELVAAGEASRLVVVCPNSFKGGWKDDAEKWGLDLDFFLWNAGMEAYVRSWIKKGWKSPPVLVVNYEAIRSEAVQQMIVDFAGGALNGAYIAFDESIQIATYEAAANKAQQTKAAISISRQFKWRRVLSGKPQRKGPHDLWAQMRAIGQLDGKNYFAFKTLFCKMGGFKGKAVIGSQNEDFLATLIDEHIFRATKKDWTDLPPKIHTLRDYQMTREMQSMYDSMFNDFVLWLNDEEVVAVDAAVTKYTKLAQIQAGFIYDEDGKTRWLVEPNKNPRLNLLKSILEDEIVGKVAIPYVHKPVFELLMDQLSEYNPAYIKGQMEDSEITEQKRRFNNDADCRLILLQTRAAKYGHTLLGDQKVLENACSTMIFFENTYSSDDRSQIEDRPHRHGQTGESVLYLDLVGTSLDRSMIQTLQRNEDVFQAVFSKLRKAVPK